MIYRIVLKIRHALFNRGWRKQVRSEVPTICIGNVTVGGTGKTPHTEMLLRMFAQEPDWAFKHMAVLSRGYKRKSKGFQQVIESESTLYYGDEPMQIKRKFPQVTVAVDKNRIEGCDFLCHPQKIGESKKGRKCRNKEFSPAELIILDDAFQYRNLLPTVNIVLVDYSRPITESKLLPYGNLRDLPQRVRAADIIIITKCPHYLSEEERQECIDKLNLGKSQAKVFFTTVDYCQPVGVYSQMDKRYSYSKRAILFTGIAADSAFRDYLCDSYQIVRHIKFPDHHWFSRRDILSIESAARQFPTSAVITTEKDFQRILDCPGVSVNLKSRLSFVPIKASFLSEEEENDFKQTLFGLMK